MFSSVDIFNFLFKLSASASQLVMAEILTDIFLLTLSKRINLAIVPPLHLSIYLGFDAADGVAASMGSIFNINPPDALFTILSKFVMRNGRKSESALNLRKRFLDNGMKEHADVIKAELEKFNIPVPSDEETLVDTPVSLPFPSCGRPVLQNISIPVPSDEETPVDTSVSLSFCSRYALQNISIPVPSDEETPVDTSVSLSSFSRFVLQKFNIPVPSDKETPVDTSRPLPFPFCGSSDDSFSGSHSIKNPEVEVKLKELIGNTGFGEVWKDQWRDDSFSGSHSIKDAENEVKLKELIGNTGFGEVWKDQWRDDSFSGFYIIKDAENEVKLKELIGKGGFGEVWKGQWRGTPVAVKLLNGKGSQYSDFVQEVAILNRARHPNIVQLMAVGHQRSPGSAMIVMQLIDGSNLSTVIFEDGNPYEFLLKVRLSRDLLSAVIFLHHCKILHLDIKPSNVIVESKTKKPYLCDLGLAHIHTSSTCACLVPARGTLIYMPPECCTSDDGNMSASSASDVWALACILLEFFSGHSVWPKTLSGMALLGKFMIGDVMPASVEKLQPNIKKIVKPCFQKEPSKRPSAESMMQQFSQLM